MPVGQLGLFKLSWYLFGQEPFRSYILCGWGADSCGPVAALEPDYVTRGAAAANRGQCIGHRFDIHQDTAEFCVTPVVLYRVGWPDFLALPRPDVYRLLCPDAGALTRSRHPWWAYLLLPLTAPGVEIIGILPQLPIALLQHPWQTWHSIIRYYEHWWRI